MNKQFFTLIIFSVIFLPSIVFSQDLFPLKNGTYKGTWSRVGSSYKYSFVIDINFSEKIDSFFLWTLENSPNAGEQKKIGFKGKEFVVGTFNSSNRKISLKGYKKEDPHVILGLDNYELTLSEDGTKIFGKTESGGTWKGILEATLSRGKNKKISIGKNEFQKNKVGTDVLTGKSQPSSALSTVHADTTIVEGSSKYIHYHNNQTLFLLGSNEVYKILDVPLHNPLLILIGDDVDVKINITGIIEGKIPTTVGIFVSWGPKTTAKIKKAANPILIEGIVGSVNKRQGKLSINIGKRTTGSITQPPYAYYKKIYYHIENVPNYDYLFLGSEHADIFIKYTGKVRSTGAPSKLLGLGAEFYSWGPNFKKKLQARKNITNFTISGIAQPYPMISIYGEGPFFTVRTPERDKIEIDKKIIAYYTVIGTKNTLPKNIRKEPIDIIVRPFEKMKKDGTNRYDLVQFVSWGPIISAKVNRIKIELEAKKNKATKKKRLAEERKLEKQRIEQERRIARKNNSKILYDNFCRKNSIKVWPDTRNLLANPFAFKNQRIGLNAYFQGMVSENAAIITLGFDQILVTKVPTRAFMQKCSTLMACKVLGKKTLHGNSYVHLEYIDSYICQGSKCREAFLWKH